MILGFFLFCGKSLFSSKTGNGGKTMVEFHHDFFASDNSFQSHVNQKKPLWWKNGGTSYKEI